MADSTTENPIVTSMLDDLAAGKAVPDMTTLSGEPTPFRQRRTRSDAGQPRGPRNVPIGEGLEDLPVRGRRTRKPTVEPISKASLADIIVGAHGAAEVFISPKAGISRPDAERIADAMAPVVADYGIVLAAKVVHLIALMAVVVAVEGPIAANVIMDMQDKAKAARARQVNSTNPPIGMAAGSVNATPEPVSISRILGVEAGPPNSVAGVG